MARSAGALAGQTLRILDVSHPKRVGAARRLLMTNCRTNGLVVEGARHRRLAVLHASTSGITRSGAASGVEPPLIGYPGSQSQLGHPGAVSLRAGIDFRVRRRRGMLFSMSAIKSPAAIGIVTVSDRASRGAYEDRGGPAIREYLDEVVTSPWRAVYELVPDELPVVCDALKRLADHHGCSLVITTGGTGPAARDITPEATESVCDKLMPGFGELMRQVSLTYVPTAILSRQTAGIRGACLIVNLPGQPRAIRQCLDAVFPAIPYCIDLLGGPYLTTDEARIKAFRPKK